MPRARIPRQPERRSPNRASSSNPSARALPMLRRVLTCVAACLAGSALHAQGAPPHPSNENDLQLHNGPDTFFFYSDPSDPTDFFWKVWPKEVMRSCTGTMEIIGLHISLADTDFSTIIGANNTVLPDMFFSKSSAAPP